SDRWREVINATSMNDLSPAANHHRYARAAWFYNRLSGKASEQVLASIRERLSASVPAVEEHGVETEELTPERVRQALKKKPDVVIVAGGDGTVRLVASELVGRDIPLAIIPLGTYNNLALSLGLPADPVKACAVIDNGEITRIDVGAADETNLFFEAGGVGIDAEMFPIGEEIKRGRFLAIFQALRTALVHKQTAVELRFDRPVSQAYLASFRGNVPLHRRRRRFRKSRHRIRLRCSFLAVANGPFYGSNLAVCPGAKIDDGLLTIAVYRDFSKRELALHLWSISRGTYRLHPKMETFESRSLEVSSRTRLPVHVDGNAIGTTPVRFGVRAKALVVLVPGKDGAANQVR
ncbi:MAG TPA: diacylglycerol kinase family protein, partial [Chthoniobacterales bacterium]|nr:diacylglycerol kinase family protein [Chthoniobacterales bacterium]